MSTPKPKPIRPAVLREMESDARSLAQLLDTGLNPDGERKAGFGLLIFSFEGSELTWISNAERSDMIRMFEELLAKWKRGDMNDFPGGVDGRN
jgi:hypothetical protein